MNIGSVTDSFAQEAAVCQFFQAGQCIASNCKLSHDLPKPVLSTETSPQAGASKATTVTTASGKAESSRSPETEPSSMDHHPFSSVADLCTEQATLPTQRVSSLPPRPLGLPPRPDPPYAGQSMRGWLPDPRPARVCIFVYVTRNTSSQSCNSALT